MFPPVNAPLAQIGEHERGGGAQPAWLTRPGIAGTIDEMETPMVPTPNTALLEANVPSRVLDDLRSLVAAGWFASVDEAVADALRRFVASHQDALMAEMVRKDVEWGLRGTD